MSYEIWRVDPDGARQIVACVDDQSEIGMVIDTDRDKIDYEATYDVRRYERD